MLPYIHWPILWYGLLFAIGFIGGYYIFRYLIKEYLRNNHGSFSEKELSQKALNLSDRVLTYTIVATLVGARLGHLIFYENPETYLANPLEIFKVWEGGLASHGAAIAIIFALYLFSKKAHFGIKLSFLKLLDLVAIPIAFAAVFIRVGNFFNQEIIGKPTDMPWAIIFGHPLDGSSVVPRHPVQLYEAIFYLFTFLILWRVRKNGFFQKQGKMIGLFLVLIFTFRFFIEFVKEEQSAMLRNLDLLTMGQFLSIPFVILGAFILLKRISKKKPE